MNAIHSIKKIIKNILDNITFFFFFLKKGGKFASFSLGFFFFLRAYTLWQRVLKIHAVGFFFLTIFFSFLHLHMLPPVQPGREGWWCVGNCPPWLSTHIHNLTLAFFPLSSFFKILNIYFFNSLHVLHL